MQLPLPSHINNNTIINAINPNKDVDGFHKNNMGSLLTNFANIYPCTPLGIITLLGSIDYSYIGKHAVIVGSSNIVGRPLAIELLNKGATITICNSKTHDLKRITQLADLLIVAIGKPKFITKEFINLHNNCVIIDVGINRLVDNTLCGDVDFIDVLPYVQYITPVPNGVGPMTIAMLMQNTLKCYYLNNINNL